jgi:hypothetical protein
MTTVSDISNTVYSGLNTIDSLLSDGPDWNYMTPVGNMITYTFSVASGNEAGRTGQEAFTEAQQAAARTALAYLAKITGIKFVEVGGGTGAQIHLANLDISGANVTGLCSWHSPYTYNPSTGVVNTFTPQAYVYLDNNEWRAQNQDLTPGGRGYETLLHELGHALGLKHPFDDTSSGNTNHLPTSQDNTSNTLMSYTHVGGPYATYSQDDIAALNWLYGGDGLRGALGMNSTNGGRYITGTSSADVLTGTTANDALEGDGGINLLDGGAGFDTAVFRGAQAGYSIWRNANGDLMVLSRDASDGVATLKSVEILKFSDVSVVATDIVSATPISLSPTAPVLAIGKNANGYLPSATPIVIGVADPNTTVKLYNANQTVLATVKTDANGAFMAPLGAFSEGLNYKVTAVATDASGNASAPSAALTFSVDTRVPATPTASVSNAAGSNKVVFSGTAEAGSIVHLVRDSNSVELATATAGSDGKWTATLNPVPDGAYNISVNAVDLAGNKSLSAAHVAVTVRATANYTGGDGINKVYAPAINVAVDAGGGQDTVIFTGARANYTVANEPLGLGVTDKSGLHDVFLNVERLQFADSAVAFDLDGTAGTLYRLYQTVFGRTPDLSGLGYWLNTLDLGFSMSHVMNQFIVSKEYVDMYGPNTTSSQFLTHLYDNVLHRAPDADGFKYWLDALDNQHVPRDQVVAAFSESPENVAQVIGSIQNGIDYTPYTG